LSAVPSDNKPTGTSDSTLSEKSKSSLRESGWQEIVDMLKDGSLKSDQFELIDQTEKPAEK